MTLPPSRHRWAIVAVCALAALAVADLALDTTTLPAIFLLGPLLASIGAAPRATAAIGVLAVVLGLASAAANGTLEETDTGIRLLVLAAGGLFAVWAADARNQAQVSARAARRLALLGRADAVLAGTREPRAALEQLVGLPLESVADWCSVVVADGAGQEAGTRPRGLDAGWLGVAVARAGERGEPATSADRRVVVYPLVQRDAPAGALVVARRDPLAPDEVESVGDLAARCSSALDSAVLLAEARTTGRRLDESFALLDTFFEHAPVGLAYFDREMRYVRVNERLAEIDGLAPSEHVGRRVDELLPDMDPRVTEQIAAALAGEPVRQVEVRGEAAAAPGVPREWLASFWPVRIEGTGELIGAGAVILDITARKRAERRAAVLAEAGAVFDASLDEDETAQAVARLLTRDLADQVVVAVAEPDGGGLRRAGWSARTEAARTALEQAVALPLDQGPSNLLIRVARTGRPEVLELSGSESEGLTGGDPARAAAHRGLGIRTSFVLPLHARGCVVGAIAVGLQDVMPETVRREYLALLSDIAGRAGLAIGNARLYAERARIARTLQNSLLPPELPAIAGVDLGACYRPAGQGTEVGGDFYDCFPTRSGAWAVVVGDVCGKGAEAAAVTALARYTLRAAVLHADRPAAVLGQLNAALLAQRDDFRFCTVGLATLTANDDGGLAGSFASGGHPLPLVLRGDGTVHQAGRPGTLLGIVDRVDLPEVAIELAAGDALVLFTDGVVELQATTAEAGGERLAAVLRGCAGLGAQHIAERIEAAVLHDSGGSLRDDVAIVVLRAAPDGPAGDAFAPNGRGVGAPA